MKKRYVMGMAVVAAATWISAAQAADASFVGARAMGMAGANVASVDNNAAQYYNPAAFGFFAKRDEDGKRTAADLNDMGRKDFGFDIYAGGGASIRNNMGEFVDELSQIDLDQLEDGISTDSELADLVNLVANLNGLDQPGNAIAVDLNAGTSLRFKHVGVGARLYVETLGRVADVDTNNLGISSATGNLDVQLSNLNPQGFDQAVDYNFFTAEQTTELQALGLSPVSIQKLEFSALAQGVEPSPEYFATLAQLASQSNGGGGGPLDQNTTKVILSGFALAEVPVSYGYALNDHVSVGGNLKLMRGRVYGNQALVFDEGSGDILSKTDENFEETTTVGVDLGVMARYGLFNLGLTGRNLNSPKFNGFTKNIGGNSIVARDVTLEPQVTAGVAFIPFTTLTVEADYDLLKYETPLKDLDTQNLSLGLEWDVWRFLALRAGVTKNLAESDLDWIYTAGLGINVWLMRFDFAAAVSPEKVQFDEEEVPKLLKVAAQVSVDF